MADKLTSIYEQIVKKMWASRRLMCLHGLLQGWLYRFFNLYSSASILTVFTCWNYVFLVMCNAVIYKNACSALVRLNINF
jgi:hypothetical protein